MAKKKKNKTRRRGRIGAKGDGIDIITPLVGTLTAVGSNYGSKFVPAAVNPKITAGVKIAAGAFMAGSNMGKSPGTKKVLKAVGMGLLIEGALQMGKETGILSGTADTKGLDERSDFALEISDDKSDYSGESDYDDYVSDEFLNGSDDMDVINDEFLNGDDVDVINDDMDMEDLM